VITFILRRLLAFVPTLWLIATLSFFIVRLAPGGPFQSEKAIPPAAKAQLLHTYGLDRPLAEQYGRFLWNTVRGDFGVSYRYPNRRVSEIIGDGFRVSAELGAWALLFAVLVGVPLGVIAAVRQNRAEDYAVMGIALAGVSVPSFVLAPVLVLVFSLTLFWFPPALWSGPSSRVLPVLALSAAYISFIARLARAGMLEVLHMDFVRTARAKGLAEVVVVVKHALPIGILPVVSYLGPAAARVVTGSIVIEQVFSIPGLGRQLVGAAFNRDYTLVLGVVLFYAGLLLVLNLLVDLAYAWLDPRVELS